ncbi:MAG: alkaline phosphatase family protein [Anaerolineae bacterium]
MKKINWLSLSWQGLAFLLLLLAVIGCGMGPTTAPSPTEVASPPILSPSPTLPFATPTAISPSPSLPTPSLTPSPPATEPPPGPHRVLIVSLDGLRPDALQEANTPIIDSLWQQGAYTWRAQTTVPSVTLPSHVSMLSGVGPEKHGVFWNDWRPEAGYVALTTVFEVVRGAGLSTAMFFTKPKLLHIAKPGTVDRVDFTAHDAAAVAVKAAKHILAHKPNLLFVHFPDPDLTGHVFGWMSEQQLKAVEHCDEAMGILLDALVQADLADSTLIIVTADHGGHGRSHGSAQPADTTIPWIIYGPGVRKGYEIEREVITYDTAATALYALGLPIPEEWDGIPVREALTPENETACAAKARGARGVPPRLSSTPICWGLRSTAARAPKRGKLTKGRDGYTMRDIIWFFGILDGKDDNQTDSSSTGVPGQAHRAV